ncbi:MAG: Cof-type HAD-IIB family hydrolase [Breznakia sp.]
MYKLLALDLDETLFNSQHKVSEKNKLAIAQARAKGVKIVPCSGRGPGFLGTLYDDLDIHKDNEYSILCNGAIVIENKSGNIISSSPLSYDKAVELFHFGIKKDLCVQVFTPEKIYVYKIDENERKRIQGFGDNIVFKDDLDTLCFKGKTIMKVLFERPNSLTYLRSLEAELQPLTNHHITISFSSDRYLELNALGVHKGTGLLALAKHLQIDISQTIGVGDNYNDLGLIKDAGLGIAVQNAIDPIKNIADVTTKATHNENAIAEVIDDYILNTKG